MSLIAKLRQRIKDTRYSRSAVEFAVTDSAVTQAIAEVTAGHLVVNTSGGDTPDIDLNLSDPKFATIGRLAQAIDRINGYRAVLDEDAEVEHPSLDIEPFGPTEITGTGLDLRHRLFSESELESVLQMAVQRHNPSFSIHTLPPTEEIFVLQLAQAEVCRIQAYDTTKRRGLDTDSDALLKVARSLEEAYRDDTRRLKRALASPKEATPNTMDQGDFVLGRLYKRSLRTGFMAPMSANLPPDAAVLLEPDVRDEEDENIRFRWQRNKDYDFYSYELWLDTRPDVIRVREGLVFTSVPFSETPTGDQLRQGAERPTTSQLIFRSFGANSNFDTVAFATFVEEFGQLIVSYIQQNLEPDSDYYARLYIVDLNYETVASNVVRYHTKPLRARFVETNPLSVTFGPSGTSVKALFDSAKGDFTVNHEIWVGGKKVPATDITINTPNDVDFLVPSFTNVGKKDVVVISPTELFDKLSGAFEVTT